MSTQNNSKDEVSILKTCWLLFIGFAFFWLSALASIGVSIGLLGAIVFFNAYYLLKVAPISCYLSYKFFRSMVVTPQMDPFSYQLSKKEAPELFALVFQIGSALKAPKISKIFITTEFNAGVALYPRFGFWGMKKPMLMLGVQFLQTLNVDQLKCILAHEMAHLSKKHPGFSYWVYRVRAIWLQAFREFSKSKTLGKMLNKFLNWYMPLLLKYTFPIVRQHEYEADRLAAKVVGKQNVVDALVYTAVRKEWLKNDYLKRVFEHQKQDPLPVVCPFADLYSEVRKELPENIYQDYLKNCFEVKSLPNDTHPCLSERIESLAGKPQKQITIERSSFEELMISILPKLTKYFDSIWQATAKADWRRAHDSYQIIAQYGDVEKLTAKQLLEYAHAIRFTKSLKEAAPYYLKVLEIEPDEPLANYYFGLSRLPDNESEGIKYLKNSIDLDLGLAPSAADYILQYLYRNRCVQEAKKYLPFFKDSKKLFRLASKERRACKLTDVYRPASIDSALSEQLNQIFCRYEKLKTVYLVEKEVTYLKKNPVFLLGFDCKSYRYVKKNKIAEQARVFFPQNCSVHCVVFSSPFLLALRSSVRAIRNSNIYAKPVNGLGYFISSYFAWGISLIFAAICGIKIFQSSLNPALIFADKPFLEHAKVSSYLCQDAYTDIGFIDERTQQIGKVTFNTNICKQNPWLMNNIKGGEVVFNGKSGLFGKTYEGFKLVTVLRAEAMPNKNPPLAKTDNKNSAAFVKPEIRVSDPNSYLIKPDTKIYWKS